MMIEIMPDIPAGTVGFRVAGPVTRADLTDVVVPTLRGFIERDEPLRVLVVIEPHLYEEPEALWEGLKADVEFAIRHRSAWRRIAYVTDQDWTRTAINLTSWLTPGEVAAFTPDKIDEAKAWVVG
jgi:SpoIIAA-like